MANLSVSQSAAVTEILGRCFTQCLLSIAERDLPDVRKLGQHLLREMNERGLTVSVLPLARPALVVAP